MSEECRTRILPDEPAREDAFGSHERVARAIKELVENETGGKAIALTGSWGGGKSTVVRLLQRGPSGGQSETPGLFVFDAWAHRGDPLRRSFLESLIRFLAKRGWVNRDHWEEELDVLARRREDAEVESTPVLTAAGKLFVIALLSAPLGLALFASFISTDRVHQDWAGLPLWSWGLAVAGLPLIIALGTWMWRQVRGLKRKEELTALFLRKSIEKTRTTTLRSPEPTSIEFADTFNRLMTEALARGNRRLLVVIDNLDRVEASDAVAIWATMKTFFDLPAQASGHSWLDRFWLLVPFAYSSVYRLWGDEPGAEGISNQGEPSSTESRLQSNLAESFVEKTFQVQFRVSPPILSDWKNFFQQQMALAFPDHDSEEFSSVYRIFRRVGIAGDRPLTPRDIKLFVNKVGAFHRQWLDEIPLVLQALYVLVESQIDGTGRVLTNPDFLNSRIVALLDEPDWQRYLAALHFNVEIDKALQVLISKRIEEDLASESLDDLRELATVHGFSDVCDELIEDSYSDWARTDPSLLTSAGAMLGELEHVADGDLTGIWTHLKRGIMQVERWKGFGLGTARGLSKILTHCSTEEYPRVAKQILAAVSASVILSSEAEESE